MALYHAAKYRFDCTHFLFIYRCTSLIGQLITTCADFIPVTTYNFYEGEWYQNSKKFHASESSMISSCLSPKFANVLIYMYLSASFIYSLSWPCFGHCRVTPQNTGQNKTLNNFNVGEDWSVFPSFISFIFFLPCFFLFNANTLF